MTQLGDPALQMLGHTLEAIESGDAKGLVEEALQKCAFALPHPDLVARVLLLPGDGQSRVLTSQMNGVLGLSIGSQATLIFLWPTKEWKRWWAYTVSHVYMHLVRNLLFPQGMAAGKLVYQKTQEAETLLDAMLSEGIADAFALELYADREPPWTHALTPQAQESMWPKVRRKLAASDISEIRRLLLGDGDRIPIWTGYTMGYKIVRGYLDMHHAVKPVSLVGLTGRVIFDGSRYMQSPEPS